MFFGLKMFLILIQNKVLKDSDTSVDAGEREREILFFLQGQNKEEYLSTQSSHSFNSFCIKTRTDKNITRTRKAIDVNQYKEGKCVREIDSY